MPNQSGPQKNKKVLVVDDEQGYRDFYKFWLEPLGYVVDTAENGEVGLEMALKNKYRTIFLDIHMPKMNGLQFLKEMKEKRPEQKIVVFSSSSDPTHRSEEEAEKLLGECCLYKPVDLDEIMKHLK